MRKFHRLRRVSLGARGANVLARALEKSTLERLEYVPLRAARFHSTWTPLQAQNATRLYLCTFSLSENRFSPGMAAIGRALKLNSSLTDLMYVAGPLHRRAPPAQPPLSLDDTPFTPIRLRMCLIGDAGAAALGEALAGGSCRLERLWCVSLFLLLLPLAAALFACCTSRSLSPLSGCFIPHVIA